MKRPRVSVIMPVAGGSRFLRRSINSILSQTFSNFELLIISEFGSSREALRLIDSYDDVRIRHIHNDRKFGLVTSLNLGLTRAKGEYIARMDGDDICKPERLERQVKYLDAHPEIGILGSAFGLINERDIVISSYSIPCSPILTKWMLIFQNVIAHPSVMARAHILRKLEGYDIAAHHAEDYDLWVRATRVTKVAAIEEQLMWLRVHGRSVSHVYARWVTESWLTISRRAISETINQEIKDTVLKVLLLHPSRANPKDILEAASIVTDLYNRFTALEGSADQKLIRANAAEKLRVLAGMCTRKNVLFALKIWGEIVKLCQGQLGDFARSTIREVREYIQWRVMSSYLEDEGFNAD